MKIRLLFVLAVGCAVVLGGVAPVMSDDSQSQGSAQAIQAPNKSTAVDQSGKQSPSVQQKADQSSSTASQSGQPAEKQGGIHIQDLVVCQGIANRQPVASADAFPKEISKLYCYFRVVGVSGVSSVTVNWYYKGTLKASVQLPVRSANWRTWSSKSISPAWTGEWMVEILSSEDSPLGNIVFEIR